VGDEPECSRILEMGNFDRVGERQDYVMGGLGGGPVPGSRLYSTINDLGRVSWKYKTFYTDLDETILQSTTRKS
jgi:hypothetical protein